MFLRYVSHRVYKAYVYTFWVKHYHLTVALRGEYWIAFPLKLPQEGFPWIDADGKTSSVIMRWFRENGAGCELYTATYGKEQIGVK